MILLKTANRTLRIVYTVLVLILILLGLASRTYSNNLYPFLAENAGDALWAMMVYFGFRFLLIRKGIGTAIVASLLFSFAIEFSQLYQGDWINQIRGTLPGALVLGHGFIFVDLIRYTVGIFIGAFIDRVTFVQYFRNGD
ncbi:ribosomal maturation YjgA family protein [Mesobacillus foraminis]|uniref:ribosomal maturation YjgA family protein n=1 Tax=Mesobacillus foraminis TaxID=279826 RepID=UPI00288A7B46|nr:DUF2809 domain-containing protein [Mesobacillus foraminis]